MLVAQALRETAETEFQVLNIKIKIISVPTHISLDVHRYTEMSFTCLVNAVLKRLCPTMIKHSQCTNVNNLSFN